MRVGGALIELAPYRREALAGRPVSVWAPSHCGLGMGTAEPVVERRERCRLLGASRRTVHVATA
jgi:hypothetical protein